MTVLEAGHEDAMEKTSETWVTAPHRLVSATRRDACVVHIYPTGPGMGTRYALSDAPMVLGRGNDCDIRINDHSVSRRHARIQPGADGYYAVDLQSTNGTFVNDVPASISKLKAGDYLRHAFGGSTLEHISAPAASITKEKLKELLDVPVFPDDQHGTAIIAAAGLIIALERTGRDIKKFKLVVNGAGAASIACMDF